MQSATKFKFYVNNVQDNLFESYYNLIFGNDLITLSNDTGSVYNILDTISKSKLTEHKIIVLINGNIFINNNYDHLSLFDDFHTILKNTKKCIAEIKYFSEEHNDSILIFNAEKCREFEVFEILQNDVKLLTHQKNNNTHILNIIDNLVLDLKEVYQDGEILLSPKNYLVDVNEGFKPSDFTKIDPAFFEYVDTPKNHINSTVVQLCNDLIYYLMNHNSFINDKELSQKILKETYYINTLLYLKDRKNEMSNYQ